MLIEVCYDTSKLMMTLICEEWCTVLLTFLNNFFVVLLFLHLHVHWAIHINFFLYLEYLEVIFCLFVLQVNMLMRLQEAAGTYNTSINPNSKNENDGMDSHNSIQDFSTGSGVESRLWINMQPRFHWIQISLGTQTAHSRQRDLCKSEKQNLDSL